jgi:hypothetical protein
MFSSHEVIKKAAFKGGDISKIEKLNEKEFLSKEFRLKMTGYGHSDVDMESTSDSLSGTSWPKTLPLVDLPESTIRPEVKSLEREIQMKREQTTLAVLVFKNSRYLPDSPTEPNDSDPSSAIEIKTKLIPLEDTNEQFSVQSNVVSSMDTTSQSAESPKFYKPAVVAANSGLSKYHPNTAQTPEKQPSTIINNKPTVPPIATTTTTNKSENFTTSILNISKDLLPTGEAAEKLKMLLETIMKPTTATATSTAAAATSTTATNAEKSKTEEPNVKRDISENNAHSSNRPYQRNNSQSESNQRWHHSG